ncbi:MAG TPA: glucose-1-phosphate adenylyltransferase [Planctomycetaceae bacterium]|nr:glucose-1-phosphate adenylyltransferase [Planctomycetaceae bacterium]
MKNVVVLILGGGQGTRLYPLTKMRAKPAVPIGGKYRLIDIPLSNCINSGLDQIYVLTQFNSVSLHHHLHSFSFDPFGGGFAEILAAQQTMDSTAGWYQGTADAVRQNFNFIRQRNIEYVLILSGDQLYRMNFAEMLENHKKAGADVSIAGLPVDRETATALGIMRLDEAGNVVGFLEKPQTDEEIDHVRTDPAWIDAQGIPSKGRDCLASMGIYLFNKETLIDALEKTAYKDFGKEVFPATIRTKKVHLHLFDGYWEDIGTIRSFFEANLAMARPNPPFVLSSPEWPTFTEPRFLPPSRVDGATIRGSLIADGCQIAEGAVIDNCIIGCRCRIEKGASISNSIIMGLDYEETEAEWKENAALGRPPMGIGAYSVIENAIIDKNCRIGDRVFLAHTGTPADKELPGVGLIKDGVVCIHKEAVLHDGWSM